MGDRKDFLKIIQGGLPSEMHMRNKLPGQFKELTNRLEKVKDINTLNLSITRERVEYYRTKLGRNLERVYFINDMDLIKVYKNINNELMSFVEQAEKMQTRQKQEKDIGKEPGE